MDRVSSLIAGTLAKRGLATHALSSLALHRINGWLKERFPMGAAGAEALKISDNVVFISCSHSVVLQELQAQLPDLRLFLKQECPFIVISDIRISRGDTAAGNVLAPGNPPA